MIKSVSQNVADIRFFVDADSFPRLARELILRMAAKKNIACFFVANRKIPFEKIPGLNFTLIIVEQYPDAADRYIRKKATPADIVFTRDILLAQHLVAQGVRAINHFGEVFTNENITERRALRDFSLLAHQQGLVGAPPKSTYSAKDKMHFANALDSLLCSMIKRLGK